MKQANQDTSFHLNRFKISELEFGMKKKYSQKLIDNQLFLTNGLLQVIKVVVKRG